MFDLCGTPAKKNIKKDDRKLTVNELGGGGRVIRILHRDPPTPALNIDWSVMPDRVLFISE